MNTVWLEIFEAKKVRCFCGFRVNLEFFILEIKYKSHVIYICDNQFRNDNRLFPDGDAFKLDPKKRSSFKWAGILYNRSRFCSKTILQIAQFHLAGKNFSYSMPPILHYSSGIYVSFETMRRSLAILLSKAACELNKSK